MLWLGRVGYWGILNKNNINIGMMEAKKELPTNNNKQTMNDINIVIIIKHKYHSNNHNNQKTIKIS